MLEGKYLCEDEKQGEKRCLRERKRKESTIHWKEGICAWKKKCAMCDSTYLCIFVENHRGEISLSQSESTVRNRRRDGEENVQRCWEGPGDDYIPPTFSLSLSLSLSFSLFLSPITWVKLQKWPHSSQPTLQIEHSPCQNVIRCKILAQIFPFPSLPHTF